MSRSPNSGRPPSCSRALRNLLADVLPPRGLGIDALSALADRLSALEEDGIASRVEAHELLLESCFAAMGSLQRLVATRAPGIRPELAEEVVAEVISRLGALYDHWSGAGPFRAYLLRTLEREAWAVTQRERRMSERDAPAEIATTVQEEEPELRLTPLQAQALRRFAWYLYGSPDNPERVRSDKALVDFLALSARLERRPYSELVRDLQPRPGVWHQGRGEEDCKWWRGRAQMAQRKVQQALQKPKYRAVYEQILAELGREAGLDLG